MSEAQEQNTGPQMETTTTTNKSQFDETVDITPDIEDSPIMQELQSLVDFDGVTNQQKWLVSLRVRGIPLNDVCSIWKENFGNNLSKEALLTCFKRFAHSRTWLKGSKGGSDFYLCNEDMQKLATEISENARLTQAFDSDGLILRAHQLKLERQQKAIEVLEKLKCNKLAFEERNKIYKQPDRTWVNHVIDEFNSSLSYPVLLDEARFQASTPQHVGSFYAAHGKTIQEVPPALIFTADETMLDTHFIKKIIKPNTMMKYIGQESPEIPHTSAMCCTNVLGYAMPLFLIIKSRMFFPEELEIIKATNQFALCSTPSGWMERFTFFFWVLCFLGWYTSYLDSLGPSFMGKTGLLILDGHCSRQCPIALQLLAAFNIKVLILPGHVTHILQLFDVSLASPFKRRYTEIFQQYIKEKKYVVPGNVAATLRRQTIFAIITAWREITNIEKVQQAAAAVGLYPFNPMKPMESQYVHETAADANEAPRRNTRNIFSINNKEITTEENINEIRNIITEQKDKLLCRDISSFENLRCLAEFYINLGRTHGCCMLTVPPMIRNVHFFGLVRGQE